VVNACLDRMRRRQSRPTVPLPEVDRTPAPSVDRETAIVVRAALAQLPIDQRAALVLVDLQGYPVADAARVLGVAEGTVKSRCARGRARLAVILGHLRNPDQPAGSDDAVRNPGTDVDVPSRTGNASGATTVGKEGGS
jgi:RNA polymerase sigma-70 factor (ECF subfamily)